MNRKVVFCLLLFCMGCYCFFPVQALFSHIVSPTDRYSFPKMEKDLIALQERFPGSLSLEVYGYSRQGRPLYAAVAGERTNKRAVLIQAGIHAREHMTTTLVMMQLERLLRVGNVRETTFYLLPMTNPDGVMISLQQKGTPATDGMYAADYKSGHTESAKREYYRAWKANAAGVDLNRNFDALWERVDTHPTPSSDGYRGQRPFSEPETMALKRYTEKRSFDATISYHATGGEIFYAFSDNKKTNEEGLSLAKAVNRRLHYEIRPDSGASFGGYKDWAIMKKGIPSLTIEIGENPTPLKMEEWPDIWRRNKNLPQTVAKWVRREKGVWL